MNEEDQPAWVNPRLVRPHGWSPILHVDLEKMTDQQRQTFALHRLSGFTAAGYPAERCYHFYTNKQAESFSLPTYVWTPWSRDSTALEPAKIESVQEMLPYVADEEIVHVCRSLIEQGQLLDHTSEQLGRALADFLGLPSPETDRHSEQLWRRANEYRAKHGPAWASQAQIRPLVAQLKDVFVELSSSQFELHGRLRPYYERLAPGGAEMGDQRADDLVNQAMEEPDADRAIRLLERALRYGKTGIPASRAYVELAGRYSDRGETKRAIAYYTKSIEASKIPNAYALYWRGELYYQQEEWDKALGDFERAVSIGLFSPECEQAQEYLAELRGRQP